MGFGGLWILGIVYNIECMFMYVDFFGEGLSFLLVYEVIMIF